MRRLLSYVMAVVVAGGAVVMAQKAQTPQDLDAAMKRVGGAMGATNKALQSGATADAKTSLANLKQALMDAENFWAVNKKDDAVKMSQDSIARVTAAEAALAGDPQAAMAALKQVGATCGACHKQYRIQDENKEYHLRPGAI